MTSTRPYLVRALHEWMLDNDLTPQVVVDASATDVQVPRQFVEDGRIVLNISTSAVRHLLLDNEQLEFSARFSGAPFQVHVPINRILAIVARENGAGMSFPAEESEPEGPRSVDGAAPESLPSDGPEDPDSPPPRPAGGGRSHLKVVK